MPSTEGNGIGAIHSLPAAVQRDVHRRLSALQRHLGETPHVPEHWWGKQMWVALTPSFAVYLAVGEAARHRLPMEERRLRWAAAQGIPTPEVLERTEDWLITRRVRRDDQGGPPFVAAVSDVAARIARITAPPAEILGGGRLRRAPRRSVAVRLGRMAAGPVSVRAFLAARHAVAAIPSDTLAHGDFIPSNLPFDRAAGVIHVVDWEMLGFAPACTDLLTLWPHLLDSDDRAALLEAALVRARDRRALGAVHRWLTVRAVADLVTAPRKGRDAARVATLMERVREATTNAKAWGVG